MPRKPASTAFSGCIRSDPFGCSNSSPGLLADPPRPGRTLFRVWVEKILQSTSIERGAHAFRLRETIGNGVEGRRVVTQAAMTALNLDVFCIRRFGFQRALPG